MATLTVCAATAFVAGAVLLVGAGWGHVRRPSALAAAVRAHRVLGARGRRLVVAALGVLEVVVGSSALGALGWWLVGAVSPHPGRAVLLAATAFATGGLYAAFGVYLSLALRRSPGTPCGCLGGAETLTWVGVARAAICAVAVVPWCVPSAGGPVPPSGTFERIAVLGAGVVVAVVAWAVPVVVDLVRSGPRLDSTADSPHREPGREQ